MENKIEILDNFLSKDLIEILYKYALSLPHKYGHKSINESKQNGFYFSPIDLDKDIIIRHILEKINNEFKFNFIYSRAYFNIQFSDMDGEFHSDDGKTTLLVMVSETLKKGSGTFEIKNKKGNSTKIDFVQNRLISFPANLFHRGNAPVEKNTPRITLAIKTDYGNNIKR